MEVADARSAQALAASIRIDRIEGVLEAVPGLRSVLVEFDSFADRTSIEAELRQRRGQVPASFDTHRIRTIPVVYGGDAGPDLEQVAEICEMTPGEVVTRHTASTFSVFFCGFAPGFPYLGSLDSRLRVPRLATPRTHVPAGSVAVADALSGIYPVDLPGGWRVIGRTPIRIFNPRRTPPAYLIPGDRVRFHAITTAGEVMGGREEPSDWG